MKGITTLHLEYWTKAADLGDAGAHYELSMMYDEGKGVDKDEKKELHHLEKAAIGGHPTARHNLGCFERDNGRVDRAAKQDSLECVKILHKDGNVSKEDFTAALHAYQAAIEATESPHRRAAELRDEILFRQPESTHLGDCPICCLPIPIDETESVFMSCCTKRICEGCNVANMKREREARLQHTCPFCRKPLPNTEEEINRQWMKRVEANDPVAICYMGKERCEKGEYEVAFEYWTKAAALGDAEAHYQLSVNYHCGQGVEKDEKKELHHLEQAAIGGHTLARHSLGSFEEEYGRMNRAVKHWIIAAKLGYDDSLDCVKELYKDGYGSKDDLAAAFRGHKAAIDATKSPQREEAAKRKGV